MPKSDTGLIDFYPSGWSEQIHDEYYVEWVYDEDESIFVRLDGTMDEGDYTISPITGINADGEEFLTKPISGLDKETAHEVAATLVYAINGAIGRINGESEFTGGEDL